MVNVFIVHSGKDEDYVRNRVEKYLAGIIDEEGKELKGNSGYSNVLTLESGEKSHWKRNALKKIKKSQVVIVVVGDDSFDPKKDSTMGWEVRKANKYHKQIMLFNHTQNQDIHVFPKYLYINDPYTKQDRPIAEYQSLSGIKKRIDDYGKGYYDIFTSEYDSLEPEEKEKRNVELFQQYIMFQKTSEDLVSRRQSVSSFYISVNSALVALMGIVIGIVDNPAKLLIMFFMSVTGIILDASWINILESYGTLNAAKMKVISLIEQKLPMALYDVEWRVMSDKLNSKKYVSFTKSEKRIPLIFSGVYSLAILIMGVYLLIKYVI